MYAETPFECKSRNYAVESNDYAVQSNDVCPCQVISIGSVLNIVGTLGCCSMEYTFSM